MNRPYIRYDVDPTSVGDENPYEVAHFYEEAWRDEFPQAEVKVGVAASLGDLGVWGDDFEEVEHILSTASTPSELWERYCDADPQGD